MIALVINANFIYGSTDHDHSSHDSHSHNDQSKKKKIDKEHSHDKHDDHDKHEGHDHEGHDNHDEHGDHKGHDHGAQKAIGKNKAITEVDEEKGFKLSREAIKSLSLKLKTVDSSTFEIEKSTLVSTKSIKGIYRFRAGYFKFLKAKIVKESKNGYIVSVLGVDFGDQIVTNGLGLLRVSDVYSTDKSEYGHSH